jgi:hypothetical protein
MDECLWVLRLTRKRGGEGERGEGNVYKSLWQEGDGTCAASRQTMAFEGARRRAGE